MAPFDDPPAGSAPGAEAAPLEDRGDRLAGAGAEVFAVRTHWVRERLRVPEVERFLSQPLGADLSGNFDSLRVRVARAVERIEETARETAAEISARSRVHSLGSITSAVIGITAFAVAAMVPAWAPAGVGIAVVELVAVFVFRWLQKRLLRDFFAVSELEGRFRPDLEGARTPEDLLKLADRIRREMAAVIGEGDGSTGR